MEILGRKKRKTFLKILIKILSYSITNAEFQQKPNTKIVVYSIYSTVKAKWI